MTGRDPIEDALRGPAPDEPDDLPDLELPEGRLARAVPGPVRRGRLEREAAGPTRVLPLVAGVAVVAGLALVAVVRQPSHPAATPSGAAPIPGTTSPAPSLADGFATYSTGGLTFTYPSTWRVVGSTTVSTMGSTLAFVGTVDLSSCAPVGLTALGVDANCAVQTPLESGGVLITIGTGAAPGGSILYREPPGGFKEFIDGMPAIRETSGPIPQTRTDAVVAWTIAKPGVEDNWYDVSIALSEPNLAAHEAAAEALVRSIRFDRPAPSLATDEATLDRLVRSAVDAVDRNARESYHSTMYGCFPRTAGASAEAVVDSGPGGRLPGPVPVTCIVAIEATPLGLYHMVLTVRWGRVGGSPGGQYREQYEVLPDGSLGGMRGLDSSEFPVTGSTATPGPATTPLAIAPGSVVEVLYPGVSFYADSNTGDTLSDAPFGDHLWVVAGPEMVDGVPWYRVQWRPTPTYGAIPGWMPGVVDGHPTVQPVEPDCPSEPLTVAALVALHPAERLICLGGDPMTLGPVILEPDPNRTPASDGSPSWLARTSVLTMFDPPGPGGVEGPLLVRAGPDVADLPTGVWLEVIGHVDDPAAASCTRHWTESDGAQPETTAEQVLSCREQFVITAVHQVAAP
jgi:hypothetical protein